MNDAKHAAGPWEASYDGHGGIYIGDAEGRQVGFISRHPEQDRNAALVQAAPDLLDALLATYEALGISYPLHSSDMDKRGAVLAKACAAIAKATKELS
jgi:hypothetical protein